MPLTCPDCGTTLPPSTTAVYTDRITELQHAIRELREALNAQTPSWSAVNIRGAARAAMREKEQRRVNAAWVTINRLLAEVNI